MTIVWFVGLGLNSLKKSWYRFQYFQCVEIFNLSEQIMESVYDTFGVQLEIEINVY